MGNNIPKGQHYIPKMLLKNFCDGNDRLWVEYEGRVFKNTIGKAFVENDLYTKADFNRVPSGVGYQETLSSITRNYDYEQRLGEIESAAGPAIRQILERARLGECPKLSASLRKAWKKLPTCLWRVGLRNRKSVYRLSAVPKMSSTEQLPASLAKITIHCHPRQCCIRMPRILDLQKMVISNADARFAAGDHPKLEEETARFSRDTGLCVAIIRIPNRGFVIGSHGLAIVEAEHRRDPAAGSWLPIASDVAVQVTPFPDREILVFLDRGNDGERIITMINEASATRSKMVAGGSRALIRAVTRS